MSHCAAHYQPHPCQRCVAYDAGDAAWWAAHRAAAERDRRAAEAIRWRVDPWGGAARCATPTYYGWEDRDGAGLGVTVAVWVGNRVGLRCAAGGEHRAISG